MGGELWMKLEMLAMSVSSKTMEGMEEIRNVPINAPMHSARELVFLIMGIGLKVIETKI